MKVSELNRYYYKPTLNPFHTIRTNMYVFLPIGISLTAGLLLISFVFYLHKVGYFFFCFLILLVLSYLILLWLHIITNEGLLGYHTSIVRSGLRLGFQLFILSEAMLFLSLFWGFLHSALSATLFIGTRWPPVNLFPYIVNEFEYASLEKMMMHPLIISTISLN